MKDMADVERVTIHQVRLDTAVAKRVLCMPGTTITLTEQQAADLDRMKPAVVYDPRARARRQASEVLAAERMSQVAQREEGGLQRMEGAQPPPAPTGAKVDARPGKNGNGGGAKPPADENEGEL
jgi:hypothetical protein